MEKKAKLRQTRVWPRVSSFWGVGGALFLFLFFGCAGTLLEHEGSLVAACGI